MFENKKLLSNLIMIAGISLSIFFLVNAYSLLQGNSKDKITPTITVSGEGEHFAIPDTAMFTFTVQKDADTQKIAREEGTKVMNKILDTLRKDYGMTDKEMKVIDFSINPKYQYVSTPCVYGGYCPPSNSKISGYTFTNTVTVKVTNLDNAGEIGAKLAELGAMNVNGPNLTLKNEDEAKDKARTDAIEKAKDKAEVLAGQLGVKLGKITSFSENNNGGMYPMYESSVMNMKAGFGADMQAPAVNLPVGENKYSSNVTITYEIK